MLKTTLFLLIFTLNSHSAIFRMPPENPIPESFDQFIFDNSLKTIIFLNLKKLKEIDKMECSNTDCKYFLVSPNILEIYKNGEKISYILKLKN
ncbi:hypothetical protein CL650_000430 [bacterium]|nr:hypothetical protein [bacterium]|tara:strand:+ start:121 stop:399 length:279 start_codon:yes stop_codon:yes gene_type:complete